MYTDFTGMRPGSSYTMRLDSEYVPPTTASCLTFYFIPMSFDETKSSFYIVSLDNTGLTVFPNALIYKKK